MASQVTDFQTGVSANTDVAFSKAAQHTHANKALLEQNPKRVPPRHMRETIAACPAPLRRTSVSG